MDGGLEQRAVKSGDRSGEITDLRVFGVLEQGEGYDWRLATTIICENGSVSPWHQRFGSPERVVCCGISYSLASRRAMTFEPLVYPIGDPVRPADAWCPRRFKGQR